jgi:hypothetical protein
MIRWFNWLTNPAGQPIRWIINFNGIGFALTSVAVAGLSALWNQGCQDEGDVGSSLPMQCIALPPFCDRGPQP